jgi:hypothetical protein
MLRLLSVAAVACVMTTGALAPSQAAEGRKKSLLTGVAIGAAGAVAAGVIANQITGGGAPAPAPAYAPPPPPDTTGSVRRARYERDAECRMVPTRLFNEDGDYVKTERIEVCR